MRVTQHMLRRWRTMVRNAAHNSRESALHFSQGQEYEDEALARGHAAAARAFEELGEFLETMQPTPVAPDIVRPMGARLNQQESNRR